jgi:hypothetical protein
MFRCFNEVRVVMLSYKVLELNLSPDALGCLLYISATHEDYNLENNLPISKPISPAAICNYFGLGSSRWARISKELRKAKVLELRHEAGGNRLYCVNY